MASDDLIAGIVLLVVLLFGCIFGILFCIVIVISRKTKFKLRRCQDMLRTMAKEPQRNHLSQSLEERTKEDVHKFQSSVSTTDICLQQGEMTWLINILIIRQPMI